MKKEHKIYIIGHKNPDTDSICSAIAYADIKNRTCKGKYIPKRAGALNEETSFVLDYFQTSIPGYLPDVRTQVKDMDFRETPGAAKTMSIKNAWKLMQEYNSGTLPILTKDGRLEGLITHGDIAKSYMDAYDNTILAKAKPTYESIAETLEGTILVGDKNTRFEQGKVWSGASQPDLMENLIREGDLIIVGNRSDAQLCAIDAGIACMIVCMNAKVSHSLQRLAQEKNVAIISTPHDAFTVARLIHQSIPIEYFMKTENLITFKKDDYLDQAKEIMAKTRFSEFPVVNAKGKYMGTVSRASLLNTRKKHVILVDHNEKSQAIDNIEEAEIIEMIDHHRIGSLETFQPVLFRNQPVGCTATIIHQIYEETGLEIPKNIAGCLCAAIISDTLLFRSPTCTKWDQDAAMHLAEIAGLDIEAFATDMFRAGSNLSGKAPEEIFYQDFKKFICGDMVFGVGQISSMDAGELGEVRDRLMPIMKSECGKNGISMVFFMLTDIISESTQLLSFGEGSDKAVNESFNVEVKDGSSYLPGVVSRKKQLIPKFMQHFQNNN